MKNEINVNDTKTDGTAKADVIHGRDDGIKNGNHIGDGDKIYAGSGDDVVFGDAENDFIDGGDGDDTIFGDVGHDELRGGAGDDVMVGGAGNDIIRGGNGNDTAVYTGKFEDYTLEHYENGWKKSFLGVVDNRPSSPDGHDYVQKNSVEYLVFKDGAYNIATTEFKEGSYEDTLGNRTPFYVDKYSTVETLTNKTFMGKPVFRKIFASTIKGGIKKDIYYIVGNIEDLEVATDIKVETHRTDSGIQIFNQNYLTMFQAIAPQSEVKRWGNRVVGDAKESNNIAFRALMTHKQYEDFKIMVEYTKK